MPESSADDEEAGEGLAISADGAELGCFGGARAAVGWLGGWVGQGVIEGNEYDERRDGCAGGGGESELKRTYISCCSQSQSLVSSLSEIPRALTSRRWTFRSARRRVCALPPLFGPDEGQEVRYAVMARRAADDSPR